MVLSALPGTPAPSPTQAASQQAALSPDPLHAIHSPGLSYTPHSPAQPRPCLRGSHDLCCSSRPRRGGAESRAQGEMPCAGRVNGPSAQSALSPCHRPEALGLQGSQGRCLLAQLNHTGTGCITATSPSTTLCFSHIQCTVTIHSSVPCTGQAFCLGVFPSPTPSITNPY